MQLGRVDMKSPWTIWPFAKASLHASSWMGSEFQQWISAGGFKAVWCGFFQKKNGIVSLFHFKFTDLKQKTCPKLNDGKVIIIYSSLQKKKERGFVWLETVCDLCWLHPENQITTKLECRFQGSDGSENTTTKRWRDCNSGKQQELLCPHRGLETCPSLTNISIIIYSSPDLGPPPGDAVDKICKNVSLVTLPCHQTTLAYPKIPM